MTPDRAFQLLTTQIQNGLTTQFNSGLFSIPLSTIAIGPGWPTVRQLHDMHAVVNGITIPQKRLVTVYDRGMARDVTRWHPDTISDVVTVAGISSALSSSTLDAFSGQSQLTITGTPNPNDAVSLVITVGKLQFGWVAIQQAGDNLPLLAFRLARGISSSYISADNQGTNSIRITNQSNLAVQLLTATGNIDQRLLDGQRICRYAQVITWCATAADRSTVATAVKNTLTPFKINWGVQDTNGEWLRILPMGDLLQEDDVQKNYYRRDTLVELEYSETIPITGYSVLAPLLLQELEAPDGSIQVIS